MYFDVTNINLNWKQICITHPFNGRGSKLGRKLGGRFSKKQCVIWKSSFLSPYVLNQQLQAYHPASTTLLCLYMQSNKIHKVFQWVSLFSTYVSSKCFGSHRSIIRSVLYKLYLQIWYVVIRVLLDTSSRYGWTCRVVRWGPKHVELT